MIRIVIENAFVFLLPTLVYFVWVTFKENRWPGLMTILRRAPLVKLFVTGAFLMLAVMALTASREGNKPGDAYQPSVFKDGRLERGNNPGTPSQ